MQNLKFLMICGLFFSALIGRISTQALAQNAPENSSVKAALLSHPPKIVSSINPIYQIAKFISSDEKNNSLLISSRASIHDYQIKSSDISKLREADVVFYIGNNLENNLPKALIGLQKQPRIVQLIKSKNIKLLTFQARVGEESSDLHIWLNPQNAIGIATDIADTLAEIYPDEAKTYQKNLEQFKIDVKNMNQQNELSLFKARPKSFLIDLNSTAYFEDYYNMPAAGVIRYTYDQELTLKDIDKINILIKKENVACLLGSFQEKNGFVLQIANNNKIKFALIDIIGNEVNYNQNGYTKMMSALADEIEKCAN